MKPLGRKAYGSIGHLPNSRMGPGDHAVPPGAARICCEKVRDRHDSIIVQEKLDGSCCAVALLNGAVVALGRAGWLADTSPYEQHRMFAHWVRQHEPRFRNVLREGERIVGEWLAQAHSTRYALRHEPFVAFDLMADAIRLPIAQFNERIESRFPTPYVLSVGPPIQADVALRRVQEQNAHGAVDLIEGVMYRVERQGQVDFLAKYVRPDKLDGIYLPEISGRPAVWNWTAWEPKAHPAASPSP
jgi:RNA ligase-like protein